MTASRYIVITKLAATSRQLTASRYEMDCEIDETLRHLIGLLIRRYKIFRGPSLPLGDECTDGVFSAAELHQLIRARTECRAAFDHRVFAAIVRDELRKAPEDCAYQISGLFVPNDSRPKPEPVRRGTVPLTRLLEAMMENDV